MQCYSTRTKISVWMWQRWFYTHMTHTWYKLERSIFRYHTKQTALWYKKKIMEAGKKLQGHHMPVPEWNCSIYCQPLLITPSISLGYLNFNDSSSTIWSLHQFQLHPFTWYYVRTKSILSLFFYLITTFILSKRKINTKVNQINGTNLRNVLMPECDRYPRHNEVTRSEIAN